MKDKLKIITALALAALMITAVAQVMVWTR